MCSAECASDRRHTRHECKLITENKVRLSFDAELSKPNPIYSAVIALRMLEHRPSGSGQQQRTADAEFHWARLQELPDHARARRGCADWRRLHEDVVLFLRMRCFMSQWGEEELHRMLGVFLVNALPLETKAKGLLLFVYFFIHRIEDGPNSISGMELKRKYFKIISVHYRTLGTMKC